MPLYQDQLAEPEFDPADKYLNFPQNGEEYVSEQLIGQDIDWNKRDVHEERETSNIESGMDEKYQLKGSPSQDNE